MHESHLLEKKSEAPVLDRMYQHTCGGAEDKVIARLG